MSAEAPPELPTYLAPMRAADGAMDLSTPESSLLLVHLDRAIKCERAQAMDRLQRSGQELGRVQALLHAETQRVASARAATRVSEEKVAAVTSRATTAERRAEQLELALNKERKTWHRERTELVARANAPREEPPATLLDRLFVETEKRPEAAPEEVAEWLDRARAYVATLESVQRANAPSPREPSPRKPSPRVASPRDYGEAPAPVRNAAIGGERERPRDEMEKLLMKYEMAKEKLQALEMMYPGDLDEPSS